MKRILALSLFAFLLCSFTAAAAEKSKIELTDGSTITGEVVEMSGGIYKIRTDSMGELKIPSNRIISISPGSTTNKSSGKRIEGPDNAKIEAIQKDIISDPKMIELVQALMSEPELQEALKDPSMMEKINSGDTAALEKDPNFQKFMNHPKVKEIMERQKNNN